MGMVDILVVPDGNRYYGCGCNSGSGSLWSDGSGSGGSVSGDYLEKARNLADVQNKRDALIILGGVASDGTIDFLNQQKMLLPNTEEDIENALLTGSNLVNVAMMKEYVVDVMDADEEYSGGEWL